MARPLAEPCLLFNRRHVPGVVSIDFDPGAASDIVEPYLCLPPAPRLAIHFDQRTTLPGGRVRVEVRVPNGHSGWIFPDDPFISYSAADEQWCRPLRIGHAGELYDTLVIKDAVLIPTTGGVDAIPANHGAINVLCAR